jgi:hypothetical protein
MTGIGSHLAPSQSCVFCPNSGICHSILCLIIWGVFIFVEDKLNTVNLSDWFLMNFKSKLEDTKEVNRSSLSKNGWQCSGQWKTTYANTKYGQQRYVQKSKDWATWPPLKWWWAQMFPTSKQCLPVPIVLSLWASSKWCIMLSLNTYKMLTHFCRCT